MVHKKEQIRQDSTAKNSLLPKDEIIFRNMTELYHSRNYKKALKVAETLVAKYPEHGESLSFKALILHHLEPDRIDEILEIAKDGLKYGISSYISWHILGVIYKYMKRYKEALKCFIMALKKDPANDRLHKDICCLEIELCDYSALRRFSSDGLKLKSMDYREWALFAFSQHLCGNLTMAAKVLEEADKLFNLNYRVEDYELSEAIMYRGMVHEHMGDFDECLRILEKHGDVIKDKITYLELKGKMAFFCKNYKLSNDCYKQLLKLNPNNARYVILYLITHRDENIRNLFLIPKFSHSKPKRGSIYDSSLTHYAHEIVSEITSNENSGDLNLKYEFMDESSAILPSNEVFDIDGEYSSAGWTLECSLYHNFDRYISKNRNSTKEASNYSIFYSYRDYVNNISRSLDLNELPAPDSLDDVNTVISVVDDYLMKNPAAKHVLYTKYRKSRKRDKYPLFIFTRQLTSEESKILLEALDKMDLNNSYLYKCFVLSFTSGIEFAKHAHDIICQLIDKGVVNSFKYFLHTCTFEVAYIVLFLLSKYSDNLRKGRKMDHNIFPAQSIVYETSGSVTEHNIICDHKLILVNIFLAKMYDLMGAHKEALDAINSVFDLAPTSVDLFSVRGKIYRHMGDFESSNYDFAKASDLDKSDRQTSAKASKALLRANEFDSGKEKWKKFLIEDTPEKENKDNVFEVPSFKFELIMANKYKSLYYKSLPSGNADGKTALEWWDMAQDIYSSIIEKHNEIYVNQLEFHNYCLNRLAYRIYYNFLSLRNVYCSQGYFIKAAKGRFRCLMEENTKDKNEGVSSTLEDCTKIMRDILSQRVYDSGLYHFFYQIAEISKLSFMFKMQCIMRIYNSSRQNPLSHNLFPIVFHLLFNINVNTLSPHESLIFYKTMSIVLKFLGEITIDVDNRVFLDENSCKITPRECSWKYLDYLTKFFEESGIYTIKHVEGLIYCLYDKEGVADRISRIFMLSKKVYSDLTFGAYHKHHNFFAGVINSCNVESNIASLQQEQSEATKIWRERFPSASFDKIIDL
ncbi:tetratricopeptide repeat domain containing protein [Theileria equi strain WA]|uniref:Tetratricopeptide repeat domain containing protein n=1 Tax=Theileria equi strain WA TaxID=1537102 RepID=L1LG65_THEEQ|nr:tetratricopeptide repeat domain containing protein [Theileria equi strain WA]EKX74244.1 tetratricopeptide repeat domain containing protein [Theileria equi strain WA]|eukprot:XP_004833696.1 tetratricopeptide repeat domain containing protein [Theileria equi strain WA]